MPWSRGAKTVSALVKEVSEDASMAALVAGNNASVRMKPEAAVQSLVEPLKKHKGIKKVDLSECEINDAACKFLAELLTENHVIEEVILEKNKISSEGAKVLADALIVNKGVRTLNLMQQASNNFGEETLDRYITMFNDNITLTKILWRLESRQSVVLNKLQMRNVEIKKRQDKGEDFTSFLPDHLRQGAAGAPAAASEAASAPAAPEPVVEAAPAPAAPEPAVEATPAPAAEEDEGSPGEPTRNQSLNEEMEDHVAAVEAAVGEVAVDDGEDEAKAEDAAQDAPAEGRISEDAARAPEES